MTDQRRPFPVLVMADASYQSLESSHGLPVHRVDVGATAEASRRPVSLGGGVHAGRIAFGRVSATSGTPAHALVGLQAVVALDVVRLDRAALVLGTRGDADWTFRAPFVSAGLAGGLRYAF